MANAYPPDFCEAFQALRAKQPADTEPIITFLEADPYFFRSGYKKADCLQLLKRAELSPHDAERLRQVILTIVDRRDGREFAAYCRLARFLDSPGLRQALEDRQENPDPDIRRRARWVLESLP